MAAHDQNMEQQKNKGNQDPNRTQSSGMGGSTSQQSGKQQGTQQGSKEPTDRRAAARRAPASR